MGKNKKSTYARSVPRALYIIYNWNHIIYTAYIYMYSTRYCLFCYFDDCMSETVKKGMCLKNNFLFRIKQTNHPFPCLSAKAIIYGRTKLSENIIYFTP